MANASCGMQSKDPKCNRICKLSVSSSCLDTFYDPYSSFLNYQFLHYLVEVDFINHNTIIVIGGARGGVGAEGVKGQLKELSLTTCSRDR